MTVGVMLAVVVHVVLASASSMCGASVTIIFVCLLIVYLLRGCKDDELSCSKIGYIICWYRV